MSLYPEHDKLREVEEQLAKIEEFLDWLASQGMRIATEDYETGFIYPTSKTHRYILATYFGIDLTKIEEERKEMLKAIRQVEYVDTEQG